MHAEVAKIYGENTSSIHEVVKKEKETCASFAAVFETAKVTVTVTVGSECSVTVTVGSECSVTVTVGSECLVKMKKALNLYNKLL